MNVKFLRNLRRRFLIIKSFLPVICVALLLVIMIASLLKINSFQPTFLSLENRPVIIIDPGHGGEDGGAVGLQDIVEKDINLSISKMLRELFVLDGYKVIMTRESDVAIGDNSLSKLEQRKRSDMQERLKIIEEHPNSIFISIHQNLFYQTECNGAQIFFSPNHPQSEELAISIKNSFRGLLQPDNERQEKKTGDELYLLYNAKSPAVMVECGFISNPTESNLLLQAEHRQKVAYVIFKGTRDFLSNLDASEK